jgi:two-component system nitrogen regulation sensor histidine kinase NtrY
MGRAANSRNLRLPVLGGLLLLLLAGFTTLNGFKPLSPNTADQILVFTSLSTVAFLLFVLVLVLLVRVVLKMYADQRSRVFGSHLRTRMLWGAVLVSLLPILFFVLFGYNLLNRSFDRWFAQPGIAMRDESNWMALELSRYATANARAEAAAIAASLPPLGSANSAAIATKILRQHDITLQGGFAVVYRNERPFASMNRPSSPANPPTIKVWTPGEAHPSPSSAEQEAQVAAESDETPGTPGNGLKEERSVLRQPMDGAILLAAQRQDDAIFSLGRQDFALGLATLPNHAAVVVGLPMPQGLSTTMAQMRSQVDTYWKLYNGRRELRRAYLLVLLMMTMLALFAASWLALHLSKQITAPVEELADAMIAVAAGDYARRVEETPTEEMGELVHSFNQMASDLESSRRQVQASTLQISAQNATLEARRAELETMLETIPNGVATLNTDWRVVLVNRALTEVLDPGGQLPFAGKLMQDVFPAELVEVLDRLIRRSHRMGTASAEVEIPGADGEHTLAVTVALLEEYDRTVGSSRDRVRGYVVVVEDATELLRAQKQSAWKEVARRVAHEIKNPLTPISLNAEQIRRHIDRISAWLADQQLSSPSTSVIRHSSDVITTSVESMRQLVNQFGALAEFPSAQPRPADLNEIVERALALFAGRLDDIRVVCSFDPHLPSVLADPEALCRALSNLIDNAAEAMQASLLKELRLSTAPLDNGMIELVLADTGSGLTDEMRERLFLPYFSTKQRGTGLGLAIAAKIIQEHGGSIRAEKNEPAGARFIVELRPAITADIESTTPSYTASNTYASGATAMATRAPAIPLPIAANESHAASTEAAADTFAALHIMRDGSR